MALRRSLKALVSWRQRLERGGAGAEAEAEAEAEATP